MCMSEIDGHAEHLLVCGYVCVSDNICMHACCVCLPGCVRICVVSMQASVHARVCTRLSINPFKVEYKHFTTVVENTNNKFPVQDLGACLQQ
jgi:hypothetical protein